jgi:hypothetical protein
MDERPPVEGFVYFASDESGLVKIGMTAVGVPTRLEEIERHTGKHLRIIHWVASNDAYWLEAKFHRYFNAQRSYDEWFHLTEDDLAPLKKIIRHDRLVINGREFDNPDTHRPLTIPAKVMGSKGGKTGGPARAAKLTPEERQEVARQGGRAKAAKKAHKGTP